ncbi:FkbM family methyltransferase [Fulvivirga sedimenti]|uniref:FkbM family methyltransferase n=1 Tax=Fulvivirga sedimenti TaxID=2879465 RepID=A0A9X1KYY0_9BACT|nr:FkbM family methyltransferase [Fulvivirga sedimenti]MCA6078363.1 FkbM family methyltransferase [Fulvivirga sedimenti]
MKNWVSATIKRLFSLRPLEGILRWVISYTGTDNFLIHLVPTNDMYPGGKLREVTIDGLTYKLDLASFNNWSIYWRITAELRPKNFLYDLVKEDDIIIDVGAHIGEVSMNMARKATRGKIYAIEGFPPTYERLVGHITANSFENIIPIQTGVGESVYHAEFSVNERNAGSNTIARSGGKSKTGIEINMLDNILEPYELNKIDLIKIDIEGFEVNALKGARGVISSFKPRLFVEMSDHTLRKQGTSAAELYHTIKKLGYTSVIDIRTSSPLNENSTFDNMHTDILAAF